MVSAGGAEHDLVFYGKRGGCELKVGLTIGEVGLPGDFAGLLVGGNDPGRIIRDGDDQIAPQRCAPVGERQLFLAGVHTPQNAPRLPRAPIDLVQHAPLIDDVEKSIFGQWS